MKNKNDLAIFIDSFDGYSDLWNDFFKVFNYYWDDCIFRKYLVTNELDFFDPQTTIIKTGKEVDWFQRTIKALESINEDYVLFMLEDYFISKKPKNEDFIEIMDCMEKENVFSYRLSVTKKIGMRKSSNYIRVSSKERYKISLQMAIWNRKKFLEILKEIQMHGGHSPWDFENYFVNKSYIEENEFFVPGILNDLRDLLGYKNGVLQGKWMRSTVSFYKKKGISLDTHKRGMMDVKSTIYYNIKKCVARYAPTKLVPVIRYILKKFGFKFVTD